MDIFEYLPQLIIAYDGNDEFANLIHVKKADRDKEYYCPCCGGIVKPRALDSNKEQSHYYHVSGKCTKESQLHFFCKNWLFEKGSKFYIGEILHEVDFIEIEKTEHTPFGDYRPDITATTTDGQVIYFELFFTNRKTGDDYFCKWDYLENDVVEINIKEYMVKTDITTIPHFNYLYHNGVCYSKPYVKRDLYANTIARIKHELTRQSVLNYKARIEQLDWFWQKIINKDSHEEILKAISYMEYDDMVSCYEIIKRKQCVKYLKDDVLDTINQKVISDVRKTLGLPHDENIYFDLRHVRGRTYEAGIRLKLKTEHIVYDKLIASDSYWYDFDKLKHFPKIVFSKNIVNPSELNISENEKKELKDLYEHVLIFQRKLFEYEKLLSDLECDKYKIRVKNNLHTVLIKNDDNFDILFEDCYFSDFDIEELKNKIDSKISDNKNKEFLSTLFCSEEYKLFIERTKQYDGIDIRIDINKYIGCLNNGIRFKMYICNKYSFDEELNADMNDFIVKANACEEKIKEFVNTYRLILNIIERINKCKNKYWKASLSFDFSGYLEIKIDQNIFIPKKWLTFEKITLGDVCSLIDNDVIELLEEAMHKVNKRMEGYGYRLLEVCD